MMPLAHIGEYLVECTMLTRGMSFGFWNGVREKAMEDLAALKCAIR